MSLQHFSTKDRILHAAEELFAAQGFATTSLRQVTSRADVNPGGSRGDGALERRRCFG